MNEHANCVYCVLSCNELNFFELKFSHTCDIPNDRVFLRLCYANERK